MKNWLYNDSLDCWHNLDEFVKITIIKDGAFFDVMGVQRSGVYFNFFISSSLEEAEDWLDKFLHQNNNR